MTGRQDSTTTKLRNLQFFFCGSLLFQSARPCLPFLWGTFHKCDHATEADNPV